MSENKQVSIKFTDAHLEYVRQYGGSCRDCADENGVCPSSGLPCANSVKAIKHVLDALEYGINHGYAPPINAAALSASAGEKKDSDRYRWIKEHGGTPQGAEFWPGISIGGLTQEQDDEWCDSVCLDSAIDKLMK